MHTETLFRKTKKSLTPWFTMKLAANAAKCQNSKLLQATAKRSLKKLLFKIYFFLIYKAKFWQKTLKIYLLVQLTLHIDEDRPSLMVESTDNS